MAFVYLEIVPSRANRLLPQPLMEQFDTLLSQCIHIEHIHEGVWSNKFLVQNDSNENLDNFPLIWLLYMQRQLLKVIEYKQNLSLSICIDSTFMGQSTPTTAFAELIQY